MEIEIQNSIQKIEKLRNARLLVYFLSEGTNIAEDIIPIIYSHLKEIGKVERLDLFLYTRGGVSEIPIRLVNLYREFCSYFSVIVPHRAHSAGTLICLGADEIVMGELSELSSVDPQTLTPLNPPGEGGKRMPLAVEDILSYFRFIQNELGIKDEQAKAEIFKSLVQNIHPLIIGSALRSHNLIQDVSRKLLNYSKLNEEQKEKVVSLLAGGLFSHTYLISRKEAKETLNLNVVYPDDTLWNEIINLYNFYLRYTEKNLPYIMSPDFKMEIKKINLAIVQTSKSKTVLEQALRKSKTQTGEEIEMPVYTNWKHSV